MEGVDYSGARPNPTCLYGKGKRFAGRYYGPGGSWKHATRAETQALLHAGLAVFALAEGDERDPLKGRPAGRAHAISADAAARQAGMPADRPIYFAVDFDMTTAQSHAVGDYLAGCADEIGLDRVGVYGGIRTIDWAATVRAARWFFQTYAWSGGAVSRAAHVLQYRNRQTVCGGDVDLCRSLKVDFGQWPHPTQGIGSAPPTVDPSVSVGAWDYTDIMAGVTTDLLGLGGSMDAHARQVDQLRTL